MFKIILYINYILHKHIYNPLSWPKEMFLHRVNIFKLLSGICSFRLQNFPLLLWLNRQFCTRKYFNQFWQLSFFYNINTMALICKTQCCGTRAGRPCPIWIGCQRCPSRKEELRGKCQIVFKIFTTIIYVNSGAVDNTWRQRRSRVRVIIY
jgi:hypothetical protein